MDSLTTLFRLLQIARSQPQYGYALSGISKSDSSDLAQHHYLVTMITWQLARMVKRAGAKIDVEKALEFALIHDLGELFGGDIAMPYARANPKARQAAKAFERENQKFLAQYFGEDAAYFDALSQEVLDAKSDEALISKIADYIEVTHFKIFVQRSTEADRVMIATKLKEKIDHLSDTKAKAVLEVWVADWVASLADGFDELFESAKRG